MGNEVKEFSRLMSPCKCSGTSKYVHEDCLKPWLRLQVEQNKYQFEEGTCKIIC